MPWTPVYLDMFTDICLFPSSLHQSHFTFIFHLRLPLIFKWKPKYSRGWLKLYLQSLDQDVNTIKTPMCWKGFQMLSLEASWCNCLHLSCPKTHGEALFRELILYSTKEGGTGTGEGATHCSEGSKRHTFCKRIPKINPNQKKPTRNDRSKPKRTLTKCGWREEGRRTKCRCWKKGSRCLSPSVF